MNQANTLCMVAIVLFMASMSNILCFGLNEHNLGGWGPAGAMTVLPVVGYALGRLWVNK